MRLDSVQNKLWIFLLVIIANSALFADWGTYLQITRVNDNHTYANYKAKINQSIYNYDLIAFEVEAFFRVDGDFDSEIWLKDVSEDKSDIFANWEDQSGLYYPGERWKSFKRTLYVQPQTHTNEPYRARFKVQSGWRKQNSPTGPGNISEFEFIITILPEEQYIVSAGDTLPLAKAIVQEEPDFTSGSSNEVYWNPAVWDYQNTSVQLVSQDLYYFDVDDMSELIPSVQGLFKKAEDGPQSVWFQGLEDSHTYGYVAKTIYLSETDTIVQYSNTVFSTQDNSPPESVIRPRISTENNQVELIWGAVEDTISSIRSYSIYRAEDTQIAVFIDSVVADPLIETYTWVDNRTQPGIEYNYRVRAIDLVGNMGDGERSNSVIFNGSGTDWEEIDTPEIDTDIILNGQFIQGPVDIISFLIEGEEDFIRFEVARDDTSYFNKSTGAGHRYYDSGWLTLTDTVTHDKFYNDPTNIDRVNFEFHYGEGIDLNFVNGHTYYRKVTRRIAQATYVAFLPPVIPDCYPPDDINNFIGETILDFDADILKWKVNLTWQPTLDPVSGVKQYHLYRQIETVDNTFRHIASIDHDVNNPHFLDEIDVSSVSIYNPTLSYRVVAEDFIGNVRPVDTVNWQVDEIALAAPQMIFSNLNNGEDIERGQDTLYTKKDQIILGIENFDLTKPTHYIVQVNGKEETHRNRNQDTLRVNLSDDEISYINVKAVYTGNRYSLHSTQKVIIRALDAVPSAFMVKNDTTFWGGHIYLAWDRPSEDVMNYEVWRSRNDDTAIHIGTSSDTSKSVLWTDYFELDEISDTKSNPLINYQTYSYQVRKRNVFGDLTQFSDIEETYVNKPPQITKHDTPKISQNGEKALTIHWERIYPTLANLGQKTYVYVYQDTFDLNDISKGLVNTAIIANNDSLYTYHNAVPGHNYIFRIKEIPNELNGKMSAWSEPYTITLQILEPMYLVPQPLGGMYVRWENPDIMSKYHVDAIKVFINGSTESDSLILPASEIDYMTPPGMLSHGEIYQFNVFALDSLGQVVADNSKADTCDIGAVYIPEIKPFLNRYYSGDSVNVSWAWKNVKGETVQNTSRGAVNATLQLSVSQTFPTDETQTVTIGPFDVDSSITNKRVPIPSLGNRENSSLYFKMTAQDTWGHPFETIWSNDFYKLKTAIYDPVPPRSVTDFTISNVKADSLSSDTILVVFNWSGRGVEWPSNGQSEHWDQMIDNVSSYRIVRTDDNGSIINAGLLSVKMDTLNYTFVDRASNRIHQWHIISIDSAGHETVSQSITSPVYMMTPDAPEAISFRSCQTPAYHSNNDQIDYAYEIAVDSEHFQLAYLIHDENTIDRLLCRSGWVPDLEFEGCNAWAAVIQDTTWFRMKVRKKVDGSYWESGWSMLSTYPDTDGLDRNTNSETLIVRDFQVFPNYPNPFNNMTQISYQIPEPSQIRIVLYNIKGEMINELFHGERNAGNHIVTWSGENQNGITVASGIYFLHILVDNEKGKIQQKKMKLTLMK